VKRRSDQDQAKWMAIWNEVFSDTSSETDAFRAANGALNLSARWADLHKLAVEKSEFRLVTCFVSDVFPDWKPDGIYEVQYCRTGLWKDHPEYGDIVITKADLIEAIRNFRNSSRKPFLDYNHGITDADTEDVMKQKAAGWMADLWIETLDGARIEPAQAEDHPDRVLLLKARYEVNAAANLALQNKEYALFSPTWYPVYFNKETAKVQGMTVIGGAMTNIPYFDGMQGFIAVAANARMKGALIKLAEMWPESYITVIKPDGMATAEAVRILDGMSLEVTCIDFYTIGVVADQQGDLAATIDQLEAAGFMVSYFSQGVEPYEAPQGMSEKRKGRMQGGSGGGESRSDAEAGPGGPGAARSTEEPMARSAEERLRLSKTLKLSEKATDAEIDEKLASLVTLAEKAPKPGETTITLEEKDRLLKVADSYEATTKKAHEDARTRVITAALKDGRIKKEKEEQWKARFDRDPVGCEEILDEIPPDPKFASEVGHGGLGGPGASPASGTTSVTVAEVDRLAQEKVEAAVKAGKKLELTAARKLVFDEKPALYQAYRMSMTRGGSRGGEG